MRLDNQTITETQTMHSIPLTVGDVVRHSVGQRHDHSLWGAPGRGRSDRGPGQGDRRLAEVAVGVARHRRGARRRHVLGKSATTPVRHAVFARMTAGVVFLPWLTGTCSTHAAGSGKARSADTTPALVAIGLANGGS